MDGTNKETKADRIEGTIKSFDSEKRHGFIERKDHADVFVHGDAITDGEAKNLKVGTRVEYQMEEGPKGPRAASVRLI